MNSRQIIKEELNKVISNNFISEIKGKTANNAKLVPLSEANAQRLLDKHGENGYVIISACRGENTPAENKQWTGELIKDIQNAGFSYTPMYGGFKENLGKPEEKDVFERSIMVYNQDRKGNVTEFDYLAAFAVKECQKFNQDSVLIKAPNDVPKYVKQDGSIDMSFDKPTTFNDFKQEYFSDLHKGRGVAKNTIQDRSKQGGLKGVKNTRFTLNTSMFDEAYINPAPATLNEAHSRSLRGEVFLPYSHKK